MRLAERSLPMIIDTHCHVGTHKYEPVEVLLFEMERAGVDKAVLIQYHGNSDNSYLVDCLRRHGRRFRAAMVVDAQDDGAAMRRWANAGLSGIRLKPAARVDGPDPLAQWRVAEELGLIVSVFGSPQTILSRDFAEVLHAFPRLRIVLEHLGGVDPKVTAPYRELRQVFELAHYANVYMKFPGFGEFCAVPIDAKEIPPLVELALEAFGAERLMWGSDFPPVSSREGYGNALRQPLNYFSSLPAKKKEWMFGGTAEKLWWGEAK